jgi:hypothetical protein
VKSLGIEANFLPEIFSCAMEDTFMAPKTLGEVVAMPSIIAVCFRNERRCIVELSL